MKALESDVLCTISTALDTRTLSLLGEADHSPLSAAKVKNALICVSVHDIRTWHVA
jgi:hypothetical protein